ncbi:DUF3299 domain-containing protein [Azospirillum halopraeferens]|uniref:DUF3299 domain-containing protein n=1 Tax=Azospirillum halopraeferens TaxID=34010 RepID=UPI00054D8ABE|nr:DUF3299 domain-containing protein [Azospirillum halopraeferens]
MTTRRQVLMPLALAPVAGWAIWSVGAAEPVHPVSRFHLPADPFTAPWRDLAQARLNHRAEPEFPAAVRELEGLTVRLRGFMVPLREGTRHSRFILAANPVGCPACERPGPATMVRVEVREPLAESRNPLVIAGTLRLHPHDGLFYRLDGAEPLYG